jgi:hypothetical protein
MLKIEPHYRIELVNHETEQLNGIIEVAAVNVNQLFACSIQLHISNTFSP